MAIKKSDHRKQTEYGYFGQLLPGDFVYYLSVISDAQGKKIYIGCGNINKTYHTLIKDIKHYCYEFLEHSIIIEGETVEMPKRVIIDTNVFLTEKEASDYLENKSPIIRID